VGSGDREALTAALLGPPDLIIVGQTIRWPAAGYPVFAERPRSNRRRRRSISTRPAVGAGASSFWLREDHGDQKPPL